METNNPAFPTFRDSSVNQGLTKREYFAAMAMQGFLASTAGTHSVPNADTVSRLSVGFADALLTELNK